MYLKQDDQIIPILVEDEAWPGVKRIAEKVADDFALVFDVRPAVLTRHQAKKEKADHVILFATIGCSPLLEELVQNGKLNVTEVEHKWEVFGLRLIENPWDGVKAALVIFGSDKRGTIYGMFHLSELIGVSPLVYWGDAQPQKRENQNIGPEEEMISKEPSVRYRGFFINDEWPCFGNWCMEKFGGFTAEMYDKVFELLLRLKGNYLWPAMWTSSFALDGPGLASAELADCYGVIMGNSHHEPCLRAGEEWDIVRGPQSIYGNEWNYLVNREGLLRYWEDSLRERGHFDSIITVGMRGERDSMLEGPSTLADNINILKDIITEQKKRISAEDMKNGKTSPMLLAIYKEVERYFYGDHKTPGLKDWEGIEDVILMFCEDNFGHMRFLPQEDWPKHEAGYGMYYHLDYHGGPVSYEWINSTPLSQIWEQMTVAYEHGIREVWMVNVGDLKGNEFPLSYFMELAYDYEKWGGSNADSPRKYTECWVRTQFGDDFEKTKLCNLLTETIGLIAKRRPEALSSTTYHPYHFREADRMIMQAERLDQQLEEFRKLATKKAQTAYESMVYYPLKLGLNLLLMQLYSGKNAHYAMQHKGIANHYADLVKEKLREDNRLVEEFGRWNEEKWKYMASGAHIGFSKWNEDGCAYPLRTYVEPFGRPRLGVSRADGSRMLCKNYGVPDTMEIYDFMSAGAEPVVLELANTGIGALHCEVTSTPCSWLNIKLSNSRITVQETLTISCIPQFLPREEEICEVKIKDGETTIRLMIHGRFVDTESAPEFTFYPRDGVIAIDSAHFAWTRYSEQLLVLKDYGLCDIAVKATPSTLKAEVENAPAAGYRFVCEESGIYEVELWSAPTNPLWPESCMEFAVGVKSEGTDFVWRSYAAVGEDYQAGEPENIEWAKGVVEQYHSTRFCVTLTKGVCELAVAFLEGSFVLERLFICPLGLRPKCSCLGTPENWYSKNEESVIR